MFPTTQNNITDLSSALAQSKINPTSNGSGKAFLKFGFEDGTYSFGRDHEDVTGENVVVNVATFTHGWTLWVNGSASKVTRSFVENLPDPMPAVDGNQPSESRGFESRFLDDDATVLAFETNSYGGKKGVDALLIAVSTRSATGESEFLYPIVKLTSESYKSKQGRVIHNPIFEVTGWMNQKGETQSPSTESLEAPAQTDSTTRRRRSV